MNSSNILKIKKQWIRIDNEYYLLIDTVPLGATEKYDMYNVRHKMATAKKFRIYDTKPGFESVVELNKKVKENDVIEYLQSVLGTKVALYETI